MNVDRVHQFIAPRSRAVTGRARVRVAHEAVDAGAPICVNRTKRALTSVTAAAHNLRHRKDHSGYLSRRVAAAHVGPRPSSRRQRA